MKKLRLTEVKYSCKRSKDSSSNFTLKPIILHYHDSLLHYNINSEERHSPSLKSPPGFLVTTSCFPGRSLCSAACQARTCPTWRPPASCVGTWSCCPCSSWWCQGWSAASCSQVSLESIDPFFFFFNYTWILSSGFKIDKNFDKLENPLHTSVKAESQVARTACAEA